MLDFEILPWLWATKPQIQSHLSGEGAAPHPVRPAHSPDEGSRGVEHAEYPVLQTTEL